MGYAAPRHPNVPSPVEEPGQSMWCDPSKGLHVAFSAGCCCLLNQNRQSQRPCLTALHTHQRGRLARRCACTRVLVRVRVACCCLARPPQKGHRGVQNFQKTHNQPPPPTPQAHTPPHSHPTPCPQTHKKRFNLRRAARLWRSTVLACAVWRCGHGVRHIAAVSTHPNRPRVHGAWAAHQDDS